MQRPDLVGQLPFDLPNYQCLQFENGAELNKILPQALEAQLHRFNFFYSKFWEPFQGRESLLPTQERSPLIWGGVVDNKLDAFKNTSSMPRTPNEYIVHILMEGGPEEVLSHHSRVSEGTAAT